MALDGIYRSHSFLGESVSVEYTQSGYDMQQAKNTTILLEVFRTLDS